MSYSPCLACRHTDRGRLFYGYMQTFKGEEMVRWRFRLCLECTAEVVAPLLEVSERFGKGDKWEHPDTRRRAPPKTAESRPTSS